MRGVWLITRSTRVYRGSACFIPEKKGNTSYPFGSMFTLRILPWLTFYDCYFHQLSILIAFWLTINCPIHKSFAKSNCVDDATSSEIKSDRWIEVLNLIVLQDRRLVDKQGRLPTIEQSAAEGGRENVRGVNPCWEYRNKQGHPWVDIVFNVPATLITINTWVRAALSLDDGESRPIPSL